MTRFGTLRLRIVRIRVGRLLVSAGWPPVFADVYPEPRLARAAWEGRPAEWDVWAEPLLEDLQLMVADGCQSPAQALQTVSGSDGQDPSR